MKVKDAMHTGVTCVDMSTPVPEIAKYMRDKDVGAVPVKSGENVVGIITDRDIACRVLAETGDASRITAKDIMSKHVACCAADDEISSAIELMESKKVRRLPVTDGQQRIVGMLSLGDIASAAGRDMSAEVLRAVSAHHA